MKIFLIIISMVYLNSSFGQIRFSQLSCYDSAKNLTWSTAIAACNGCSLTVKADDMLNHLELIDYRIIIFKNQHMTIGDLKIEIKQLKKMLKEEKLSIEQQVHIDLQIKQHRQTIKYLKLHPNESF